MAMCGLMLLLACGGEESEVEATEEEVSENDESVEASGEESDDGDEAAEEDPDELMVGGDLALDEETTAQGAPERRGLAHILVRYRGGERTPSSVTRSKADAETRANQALSRAQEEDFGAVAAEMSDDDANAESGGGMGSLERGLLPEALDDALFSMEVGEIRGPIESPFGYHVIRRTR